jgi:hypothetical protein
VADLPVPTRAICRSYNGRSADGYLATLPPGSCNNRRDERSADKRGAFRCNQKTPMSAQEGYSPSAVPLLNRESSVRATFLAAAAGGAAAFADVAAASRAHLGAAGEAERCVRSAALVSLD